MVVVVGTVVVVVGTVVVVVGTVVVVVGAVVVVVGVVVVVVGVVVVVVGAVVVVVGTVVVVVGTVVVVVVVVPSSQPWRSSGRSLRGARQRPRTGRGVRSVLPGYVARVPATSTVGSCLRLGVSRDVCPFDVQRATL